MADGMNTLWREAVQAAVAVLEFRGRNRSMPLAVRFWAKVYRTPGCWIWLGGQWKGHGAFEKQQAHRVAWGLTKGDIPVGMHVLHQCDLGVCVNPDHLFLGTHADNMRDMGNKHRSIHYTHPERLARGSRHGSARLDEFDVQAIRASTESHRATAKSFGVGQSAIRRARNGQTWKHVKMDTTGPLDRIVRGSASPNAKLTDIAVREIRKSSRTYRVLAKQFGIGVSVISRVKTGVAWRHVKP